MKFSKENLIIERTTVTAPIKEVLSKEECEHYIEKYNIADDEFCNLQIEIIADIVPGENEKLLELWYGLKDYGSRYFAFGTPEKCFEYMSVDESIAVTVNEYLDWDELFKGMYADVD